MTRLVCFLKFESLESLDEGRNDGRKRGGIDVASQGHQLIRNVACDTFGIARLELTTLERLSQRPT